ncbi:acetyl-CoA C-acetyltransferase [Desulfosarcina sp. BuS5]|uniref:thiolase C-terminal domain-containing protein n=1 Tax=Desulfosarcina sp. BuS5 TaxID=933262 RepID=UPI00047F5D48|nr:beta-ketoacyl synthase N-terminal-like domain-containing protein [Desulfosarcina sp. BuS5]WDN89992.1 acetyl-CoA C-acetyltransferase [Desulfosarcina sp. BuS5]
MKKRKLGRGVAVIGAGMTKFGMYKNKDSKDLFTEAFNETIASVDKGFDPNEIEALYLGNFSNDFFVHQAHWAPMISDLIGLSPKPATRTEGACASSALAFREGVFAIASGFYDIVLVGGVEDMSKVSTEEVAEGLALATVPYEGRVGFTFPGVFGVIATAYFAKYGASHRDLMNVTIKSHNNAPFNPKAQIPFTIRDMMNAKIERAKAKGRPAPQWKDEIEFLSDLSANPPVAWPMHLYDCCPISDGASCMILAAEEIAGNFTDKPLKVIGIGQGSGRGFHSAKSLTSFEATQNAAKEAYGMSGLKPEDIQFSEVHDCFSIAEIIHTEDLGFFKKGEGYKAVRDGLTRLDGPIPINTSGGLKSKGHPVGATGTSQLVEVWKQLRNEAGERQVKKKNLRIGAAHNLGGTGGTCTFTILERR